MSLEAFNITKMSFKQNKKTINSKIRFYPISKLHFKYQMLSSMFAHTYFLLPVESCLFVMASSLFLSASSAFFRSSLSSLYLHLGI